MATADRAFINAEQRVFEWLEPHIAEIDAGINGYVGELPITLSDRNYLVGERQMWCVAIVNQTETMQSNIGSPVHCHRAGMVFRAMVEKRETALKLIGKLRTVLPDEVEAGKVQRLDYVQGMTIGRDTVELANDQDVGGLYRVWLVEQPLEVQFSNDDEQIGYEGDYQLED